MKFSCAGFAIGLALLVGGPASAADFGIRDMGGGVPVPVPAPAPVPTYDWDSDWYVGVSLGANISQSATITDTDIDYFGNASRGVFARDSGDVGASPIYGLNFGRYITPSLRAEIAIDYSPDVQITKTGVLPYNTYLSAPNQTLAGGTDTNTYDVYRADTVKLARTTGLFNLLYDINTGTRFTPYIGGGVGFTWRSLHRSYGEDSLCVATSNPNVIPQPPPVCTNSSMPSGFHSVSGSNTTSRLDFAAALQAGISYNFNENVVWDNGWQMLWEGGSIAQTEPTITGDNRIVYKDSILQQFRSGIRLKFN